MDTRFFVRAGDNERVTADIRLQPDSRSILHGTVKNETGQPLVGALMLLMEAGTPESEPVLQTATFTDDDGQYYFGPLKPGALYVVKVFYNQVKLRELEIH